MVIILVYYHLSHHFEALVSLLMLKLKRTIFIFCHITVGTTEQSLLSGYGKDGYVLITLFKNDQRHIIQSFINQLEKYPIFNGLINRICVCNVLFSRLNKCIYSFNLPNKIKTNGFHAFLINTFTHGRMILFSRSCK